MIKPKRLGVNQADFLKHFWEHPDGSVVLTQGYREAAKTLEKRGLVVSWESVQLRPNGEKVIKALIDRSIDAFVELHRDAIHKRAGREYRLDEPLYVALLSHFWIKKMWDVDVEKCNQAECSFRSNIDVSGCHRGQYCLRYCREFEKKVEYMVKDGGKL